MINSKEFLLHSILGHVIDFCIVLEIIYGIRTEWVRQSVSGTQFPPCACDTWDIPNVHHC